MNYDDLAFYPRYIDLLFLLVGESRALPVILHLVKQSETVILFSLKYISEGLVADSCWFAVPGRSMVDVCFFVLVSENTTKLHQQRGIDSKCEKLVRISSNYQTNTLPKFKIAPENLPSQ